MFFNLKDLKALIRGHVHVCVEINCINHNALSHYNFFLIKKQLMLFIFLINILNMFSLKIHVMLLFSINKH